MNIEKERERFEQVIYPALSEGAKAFALRINREGNYSSISTQMFWDGWKLRAENDNFIQNPATS